MPCVPDLNQARSQRMREGARGWVMTRYLFPANDRVTDDLSRSWSLMLIVLPMREIPGIGKKNVSTLLLSPTPTSPDIQGECSLLILEVTEREVTVKDTNSLILPFAPFVFGCPLGSLSPRILPCLPPARATAPLGLQDRAFFEETSPAKFLV